MRTVILLSPLARSRNVMGSSTTRARAPRARHNISIWKGDDNLFDPPDPANPMMPGDVGKWAIGGILKHLGALTAISSPTVNSYRRLWDTGFWAPVFADWGFQNRTTALRDAAQAAPGDRVKVTLARGELDCEVRGGTAYTTSPDSGQADVSAGRSQDV